METVRQEDGKSRAFLGNNVSSMPAFILSNLMIFISKFKAKKEEKRDLGLQDPEFKLQYFKNKNKT